LIDWRDRNVLVTGVLGLIGSTLARKLMQAGARVRGIDNLDANCGGNRSNLLDVPLIALEIAELADTEKLAPLLADCEFIFHLAGRSGHLDSMQQPQMDLAANQRASLSLLELWRGQAAKAMLILASTRQVYGPPEKLPVAESHPTDPPDINGIHRLAVEQYCRLYGRAYGLSMCALRLTNTYGPGMRIKDARQIFLGIWTRSLLEGRPFEVWGGEQIRDFTYVEDAAEAFMLAAAPAAAGRVFNVGGHGAVRLVEVAQTLVQANGGGRYDVKPFPAERKRIDIGDYWADDRLIRASLGWMPKVPLLDGLRRTMNYYRTHLPAYL
jgi:UDP-glucose 4-epimerase